MQKKHLVTGFMILALLGMTSNQLHSQQTPFIPDEIMRDLNNELSGDRAFEYIRRLSHYHRIMGSRGFLDAAEWIVDKSKEFGLTNAHAAAQPFIGRPSWDIHSGKMWIIEPEEILIADFDSQPVSIAVFSRSAHLTAELVDIGEGRNKDFAGKDISGKIVLTTASPGSAMADAVWNRGAAGVVSSYGIRPHPAVNTPDQVAYMKVPTKSDDGKQGTWAVMITPRRYFELQDMIRNEKKQGRNVRVRVDIDAEFREPAEQAYAWAEIPGSEIHNQDIVLTAHLDEERTSANDNGSGCASQLEVARTILALIDNGLIRHPRRDIIFWWPNEHTSEYEFFKAHPEERKNMLVNINQDMVGARQSMGSRVQHIIRTPWSIPSFLNDVMTSITEFVVMGNNGFLAAEQAGGYYPFPSPIFSFRGSREPYHAMVVPHIGNSDQEVFCEGIIGVPGVGLVNHPDFFIHSSADDLDNVDATQLKRNAFIVAAAVLFIASAGEDDIPLLAADVYGRGKQRIARDFRIAMQHLRENRGGSRDQSYKDACNLVRAAVARESKALASIEAFAESVCSKKDYLKAGIADLQSEEKKMLKQIDMLAELEGYESELFSVGLTQEEKNAAIRIPANIDSVEKYFTRRGWIVSAPESLHPVMAKECFSLVDGKNSYLDIYRTVRSQALSAGNFYYGEVVLEDVVNLLDKAVSEEVLVLK